MKLRSISLIFSAWVLTSLVLAQDEQKKEITWVTSFEKGLKEAKESGKPIMLFFHRDGCTVCQEVKKSFRKNKEVINASKDLVCISLDTDDEEGAETVDEWADKYKFKTLPHIFFLKPDGKVIEHFYKGGYKDKLDWEKLVRKMKDIAKEQGVKQKQK